MRTCSILFSAVALSAAAISGCVQQAAQPAGQPSPTETAITLPLLQQVNGNVYRLRANFTVTGPDNVVQQVDGTGDDPSVTVSVTPGLNKVQVVDGWTLTRSTDGGTTFAPVSAALATMNPVSLIINANQDVTWVFQFIVRDVNTTLHITFGVVETPRVLSASLFINGGFNQFSVYQFQEISVTLFYSAFPLTTTDADGTKELQFFSSTSTLDITGDTHGLLAPLASQFAGGFVNFSLKAHPDGTQEFTGRDDGSGASFPHIQFGGSQAFLALDQDGFPVDTSFFAFGGAFEISVSGNVAVTGTVDSINGSAPPQPQM
jgi:hypothetical protein